MDKPQVIRINNNHYMITPIDSDNKTLKEEYEPFPNPKKNTVEYTKKGYYFLSEANYWYLKDIAQFKDMTVQDYLNSLIELDRTVNSSILPRLYHNEYYTE